MINTVSENTSAEQHGTDYMFWLAVSSGLVLVAIFNYAPKIIAAIWAAIWLIMLVRVFADRMTRSLGLLLLASCYERPILDLGIGIRGTIKLVDIVIAALFLVAIWKQLRGGRGKADPISKVGFSSLLAIVIIAVISAIVVSSFGNHPFEETRKSIYYSVKLVEYCLAFWVIQKIQFNEYDIQKYLNIFLFGLVAVAIVGIMQGVGIASNEYYTSETGVTIVEEKWAISTLGPNHTHLGTYMALAVMLSVMSLHQRLRFRYFLAILVCMAALSFSHSAVGFGMVGLYAVAIALTGEWRLKLIGFSIGIVGTVLLALYLGGLFGESAERTAEKLSVAGEDSEVIRRSFITPVVLLLSSTKDHPWGLPFGFGFRVARLTASQLPSTGDNNYFAVFMDVGILGFSLYLIFLADLYRRTKKAANTPSSNFSEKFAYHGHTWFKVVLLAMFVQEILWPLHSRGSTMLIFLVIIELSARSVSFDKIFERKREINRDGLLHTNTSLGSSNQKFLRERTKRV